MKDPRQLAFETLLKLWKNQSYSNLSIAGKYLLYASLNFSISGK